MNALIFAIVLIDVGANAINNSSYYSQLHKHSWQVNDDGHYNSIFDAYTDITTSELISPGDSWGVSHNRIPNYDQTFTQDMIDTLNARPKASSDFATGKTTAEAGEYYVWGDDIGYNGCDGYWPPGPECPESASIGVTFNLNPADEDTDNGDGCYIGLGAAGYFVNGASIYGLSDGLTYNNKGYFQNVAATFEEYDLDVCNGHAANSDYHHHHYPVCLQAALGDDMDSRAAAIASAVGDNGNGNSVGAGHSPIYGWLFDSYPIYGPYNDAANTLATPCWQKRDYSPSSATGCSDDQRSCVLVDPYDYTKGTETLASADLYGPDLDAEITTQSGNAITASAGIYFQLQLL
mmetsp:Transcript_22895/g.38185  ORF Transcript_22895/g.38185 Transcript_22895/m.38185 type:complete len:349 (+) Transcript_22895:82-1128(+)